MDDSHLCFLLIVRCGETSVGYFLFYNDIALCFFFGNKDIARANGAFTIKALSVHNTLGGVWGWIWSPSWPKVGGAAPGFEPRTSCIRVRSASHYATGVLFPNFLRVI